MFSFLRSNQSGSKDLSIDTLFAEAAKRICPNEEIPIPKKDHKEILLDKILKKTDEKTRLQLLWEGFTSSSQVGKLFWFSRGIGDSTINSTTQKKIKAAFFPYLEQISPAITLTFLARPSMLSVQDEIFKSYKADPRYALFDFIKQFFTPEEQKLILQECILEKSGVFYHFFKTSSDDMLIKQISSYCQRLPISTVEFELDGFFSLNAPLEKLIQGKEFEFVDARKVIIYFENIKSANAMNLFLNWFSSSSLSQADKDRLLALPTMFSRDFRTYLKESYPAYAVLEAPLQRPSDPREILIRSIKNRIETDRFIGAMKKIDDELLTNQDRIELLQYLNKDRMSLCAWLKDHNGVAEAVLGQYLEALARGESAKLSNIALGYSNTEEQEFAKIKVLFLKLHTDKHYILTQQDLEVLFLLRNKIMSGIDNMLPLLLDAVLRSPQVITPENLLPYIKIIDYILYQYNMTGYAENLWALFVPSIQIIVEKLKKKENVSDAEIEFFVCAMLFAHRYFEKFVEEYAVYLVDYCYRPEVKKMSDVFLGLSLYSGDSFSNIVLRNTFQSSRLNFKLRALLGRQTEGLASDYGLKTFREIAKVLRNDNIEEYREDLTAIMSRINQTSKKSDGNAEAHWVEEFLSLVKSPLFSWEAKANLLLVKDLNSVGLNFYFLLHDQPSLILNYVGLVYQVMHNTGAKLQEAMYEALFGSDAVFYREILPSSHLKHINLVILRNFVDRLDPIDRIDYFTPATELFAAVKSLGLSAEKYINITDKPRVFQFLRLLRSLFLINPPDEVHQLMKDTQMYHAYAGIILDEENNFRFEVLTEIVGDAILSDQSDHLINELFKDPEKGFKCIDKLLRQLISPIEKSFYHLAAYEAFLRNIFSNKLGRFIQRIGSKHPSVAQLIDGYRATVPIMQNVLDKPESLEYFLDENNVKIFCELTKRIPQTKFINFLFKLLLETKVYTPKDKFEFLYRADEPLHISFDFQVDYLAYLNLLRSLKQAGYYKEVEQLFTMRPQDFKAFCKYIEHLKSFAFRLINSGILSREQVKAFGAEGELKESVLKFIMASFNDEERLQIYHHILFSTETPIYGFFHAKRSESGNNINGDICRLYETLTKTLGEYNALHDKKLIGSYLEKIEFQYKEDGRACFFQHNIGHTQYDGSGLGKDNFYEL